MIEIRGWQSNHAWCGIRKGRAASKGMAASEQKCRIGHTHSRLLVRKRGYHQGGPRPALAFAFVMPFSSRMMRIDFIRSLLMPTIERIVTRLPSCSPITFCWNTQALRIRGRG